MHEKYNTNSILALDIMGDSSQVNFKQSEKFYWSCVYKKLSPWQPAYMYSWAAVGVAFADV